MQVLYLTEPGSFLTKDGNRLVVRKDKDAVIKSIGLELIEGVVLIGSCSLSSGLMVELLEREIPVTWLSNSGSFFGRLEPITGYNVERQLKQFEAYKTKDFRLGLAKELIQGKIDNSRGLLRRLNRRRELRSIDATCEVLKGLSANVPKQSEIDQVMGLEGAAAKEYFLSLSMLLPEYFQFSGRNRRPPKDPFNSLLSFGYTLLLYEIYTAICSKNLHPYLGFMHQPRRGHPALASDLMEEWRPVIVDALAASVLSRGELSAAHFQDPDENGGVYLQRDASKVFIEKFEKKLRSVNNYIEHVDYPLSFRESLVMQVGALTRAIETNDPSVYRSVRVR